MARPVALYLDKINPSLERKMMELCPEAIDLRFLSPTNGKQGAYEDADVIINSNFKVPQAIIDQCPKLRMIQRTGVGYENVDTEYAKGKGVPVCIVGNALSDSVAELVILLILSVYRKSMLLHQETQKLEWGNWKYKQDCYDIMGKTIGVVGAGRIGRTLMQKLSGFQPEKFLYYDMHRMPEEDEGKLNAEYVSLEDLMARADVISIHVPFVEANRNLIDAHMISLMKPTGVLINTARGALVDNVALGKALREKKILGAGVDVYQSEPIKENDPFIGLDNVVTLPHVGSSTIDCYERVMTVAYGNIVRYMVEGRKPLYTVNGI